MISVLMIDDDPTLSHRLKNYFTQYDIELHTCHSPAEGMRQLELLSPDLLLLDVMLPDKDGFTLCREIRQTKSLPIIMITARGELTDKVLGLEIGADDYLAKPFEPRELVARINVLLRRTRHIEKNETVWLFEQLQIYPDHHKVILDDTELNFTGMEFRLLKLLAASPGQVFSRDELLNELKGIDTEIYSRSIDILLSRLRNKLGDTPQQPRFIKTIRNMGYCFIGRKT